MRYTCPTNKFADRRCYFAEVEGSSYVVYLGNGDTSGPMAIAGEGGNCAFVNYTVSETCFAFFVHRFFQVIDCWPIVSTPKPEGLDGFS